MNDYLPKPSWLKISLDTTENTRTVKKSIQEKGLHTVCEEARCPNLHHCWSHHRTATFMILGDTCTRRCRFCSVKTGTPKPPDPLEPGKVAASVEKLGIVHAVITMVDRDDLPDGGASYLAATGRAIHARLAASTVEYLSSDLMGKPESIAILVESVPEVLAHNLETTRRLTPAVRSRSDYDRSLGFLKTVRAQDSNMLTKSGIMLGLGETRDEVLEALEDLRQADCDMLCIGQYLQPTRRHLPVKKYWHPDEFMELGELARAMGFKHVESGPLVRSSYHAKDGIASLLKK